MNKSKYALALAGLATSTLACAGVSAGVGLGAVVGSALGSSIAQASGLPIETVGNGVLFAIAAIALVAGIRIVARKQRR